MGWGVAEELGIPEGRGDGSIQRGLKCMGLGILACRCRLYLMAALERPGAPGHGVGKQRPQELPGKCS